MTEPNRLPRSENINDELLHMQLIYEPAETIPEDMLFDVVAAAQETLSHGSEHILEAARRMDAENNPVLADIEVYRGMATGKLMGIYERALASPLEVFEGNPEGKEEYARLVVQKVYATRKFMVTYAANACPTLLHFEAIKAKDEFVEACALTGHLVSMCRPDTVHYQDFLRGVI